jgi:sugar lactone lactonase YvrE
MFLFRRSPLALSAMLLALLGGLFGTASAHPGSGIVVDREGRVFFTDTGRGVWKVSAQGELSLFHNAALHWMALDTDGRFSRSSNRFDPNFQKITLPGSRATLLLNSDFPCAVGEEGSLYYADTRAPVRLIRQTPQGVRSVLAGGKQEAGAPSLGLITGISAGPDSTVYINEVHQDGTYAVRCVRRDGTISTLAANFLSKVGEPVEATGSPCRGLAVDRQGTVYVAAPASRCVVKITPQGKVSTLLRSPRPWSPTGVAVWQGEVYVLEYTDTPPGRDPSDRTAWVPRIRKVGRGGAVSVLTTVRR